MDEDERIAKLERDLSRARWLLRDWRDKHGGKENHVHRNFPHYSGNASVASASPTDLLRETNKFLEGR